MGPYPTRAPNGPRAPPGDPSAGAAPAAGHGVSSPAMTLLHLVRHGETDWNRSRRFQGHSNVPLNARGRAQARAAADRLAGEGLDGILSSDLERARRTAEAIGETLGLPVLVDPRWRERAGGVIEGASPADLAARYPKDWKDLRSGHRAGEGGETNRAMRVRVLAAVGDLEGRFPGDARVAVVTHGGVIRILLQALLGVSVERIRAISTPANAAITVVELGPKPLLRILNDTGHLRR